MSTAIVPGWAVSALRGWNRWTSLAAVLVGAVTLVAMGTPLAPSFGERKYIVPLLYNVLQFGFPLVFAVRLADRAVDGGARSLWAYALAVAVVGAAGTWPIARLLWPLLGKEAYWDIGNDLWLLFNALLYHGLGVAAYALWRAERLLRERLQQSERERAAQQRQLTASRLLALQARVEPQLLFDALARVDQALQDDIAAGPDDPADRADRRLADLIDLLRAMQPLSNARASTLGRELDLVRAHARVSGEVGLQAGWLAFDVAPEAESAPLAPLVLLPLLRRLAALPTWKWSVQARRIGERLRVVLAAPGAGPASFAAVVQSADLALFRQRLIEVHGPTAVLRPDASGGTSLLIEIDAAHDPNPDR